MFNIPNVTKNIIKRGDDMDKSFKIINTEITWKSDINGRKYIRNRL